MSAEFKYQQEFGERLAGIWMNGNHDFVRLTVRRLSNKPQSAYIATAIMHELYDRLGAAEAVKFSEYMHPNNK